MALDSQIKNLALAIRQQESGGKYDTKGASGEYGAYQFTPGTWNGLSQKYLGSAVPLEQADRIQQNKVAYNYIKELSSKGYKASQVAAAWNAGEGSLKNDAWKTNVGTNKFGVHYDTPSYVKAVGNFYKQYNGNTASTPDSATQITETPPAPVSIGRKILNFAGDVTGQRGLGEDIGGSLADIHNNKLYSEALKQHAEMVSKLQDAIVQKENAGTDASRLKNVLSEIMNDTPQKKDFLSGVQNKTTAQVLGDIGSSALGIGGGALIPGAGSVGARLAGVTGLGAGLGFTGGLGAGETNTGDLFKSTALGAGAAFLTGGLLEGAGALFRGGGKIISSLGGRTAEEILATPESELSKLTPKERSFYNTQKTASINEEFKATEAKIKEDLFTAKEQSKIDLEKAASEFKTAADKDAEKVRENIVNHLGDANKKYGALLEEALAPVEDVQVTNRALNDFLDNKYAENPEAAKAVKELFGIKAEDFTAGSKGLEAQKPTTIGELYSRIKELKSEVGKAGRSGNKALTAEEYAKSKAVDDLMSFLHQQAEGTQFSETLQQANELWREWAPLRDRIFREVKPFDQSGVVEVPLKKTLAKVASGKASEETKNFISKLEEMIGKPVGTETKTAFSKLDGVKQQAVLDKINSQLEIDKNKIAQRAAKQEWTKTRQLAEVEAERKAKINGYIIAALKWAGLSALGIGGAKALLH